MELEKRKVTEGRKNKIVEGVWYKAKNRKITGGCQWPPLPTHLWKLEGFFFSNFTKSPFFVFFINSNFFCKDGEIMLEGRNSIRSFPATQIN